MATLDRNGNAIGEATVAIKSPCVAATTGANITLSGVQTIDGVTVGNNGERVLVKDQTTPSQNGIYVASTGAWLYATDYNSNSANSTGTQVYIAGGSVNGGQTFVNLCADNPIVVGTSSCVFAAVSAYNQHAATSTTSATIGTGSKTFAVQSGKAFATNSWVVIYQTVNASNAMLGQVTSYSGTSLVVNVTNTGGSGTFAAWTVVLTNSPAGAGIMPPVGTGNVAGPGSSTAGHVATFADSSGKVLLDGGPLAGGTSAALLAASAVALGMNMLNGQIIASINAGALVLTVQTLAGNTPQANDPVWLIFRSATAGSGAISVIEVTSALSITVPAAAQLGYTTNTPGRMWIGAANNGGTPLLAVINCLNSTTNSIFALAGWEIANVTAFSGSSNTAQIFWGTGALSNVPYSVIGCVSWEAPVTQTIGTAWVAPTRVETYRSGKPLPGQVIQTAQNSTTTSGSVTSTSMAAFASNGMSQAITPSSSANLMRISAQGTASFGTAIMTGYIQIARGTTPIGIISANENSAGAALAYANIGLIQWDFPASLSATTYNIYGKVSSSGMAFPASSTGAILELCEFQA